MERIISRIDDAKMATAIIEFAKALGLSVSPNIDEAGVGNYLTTGSKRYDLNWIRNQAFAEIKADDNVIWNLSASNDAGDIVKALVDEYVENHFEPADDDFDDDEVSLEDDNSPSSEVIIDLYHKVKNQKKSPANYTVVLKNDNWIATTSTGYDVTYGNLADLYNNL